jgi:hypothetical protein
MVTLQISYRIRFSPIKGLTIAPPAIAIVLSSKTRVNQ